VARSLSGSLTESVARRPHRGRINSFKREEAERGGLITSERGPEGPQATRAPVWFPRAFARRRGNRTGEDEARREARGASQP